jgi:hypothetical protein
LFKNDEFEKEAGLEMKTKSEGEVAVLFRKLMSEKVAFLRVEKLAR